MMLSKNTCSLKQFINITYFHVENRAKWEQFL